MHIRIFAVIRYSTTNSDMHLLPMLEQWGSSILCNWL